MKKFRMPEFCKGCLYRHDCNFDEKRCIYLSQELVDKYNKKND